MQLVRLTRQLVATASSIDHKHVQLARLILNLLHNAHLIARGGGCAVPLRSTNIWVLPEEVWL